MAAPDAATVESVLLEAPVVFQITRHLHDHFPMPAGGILMGPDPAIEDSSADELHVTESFPLPQSAVQGDGSNLRSKDAVAFQQQMSSKLKTVGAESFVQGWYLSSSSGAIYEPAVLDNLYAHQKQNANAVLLVHDVALSRASGALGLRAFRLSPKYLAIKAKNETKITTEVLVELDVTYEELLEELPVRVHNTHLVNLLAAATSGVPTKSYADLRLPKQSLIESNFDHIMDAVDDFNYEQSNYNYYQRQLAREKQKIAAWQQRRRNENTVREAANKPPLSLDDWKTQFKLPEEPSRLDNLLISAQLDEHCGQIEELGALAGATLLSTRK